MLALPTNPNLEFENKLLGSVSHEVLAEYGEGESLGSGLHYPKGVFHPLWQARCHGKAWGKAVLT